MTDAEVMVYDKIIDVDLDSLNSAEKRQQFTKYILTAFIADRTKKMDIFDWLEKNKFYDCPAAKGHHGNCQGGLFKHSLEVTRQLIILTRNMNLQWDTVGSPIVVGMFHDVCKMFDYDFDFSREVKCAGGVGPIVFQQTLEGGHGSKSILVLSPHIMLAEEESFCIRYHMGAFTDKDEWRFYSEAVHSYPNVLWAHTADMVASQILRR